MRFAYVLLVFSTCAAKWGPASQYHFHFKLPSWPFNAKALPAKSCEDREAQCLSKRGTREANCRLVSAKTEKKCLKINRESKVCEAEKIARDYLCWRQSQREKVTCQFDFATCVETESKI